MPYDDDYEIQISKLPINNINQKSFSDKKRTVSENVNILFFVFFLWWKQYLNGSTEPLLGFL